MRRHGAKAISIPLGALGSPSTKTVPGPLNLQTNLSHMTVVTRNAICMLP